jgi:hypothetical protein
MILAVLAFAVMIPVAHADDDDDQGKDKPSSPIGSICIQTTDGPTVCL